MKMRRLSTRRALLRKPRWIVLIGLVVFVHTSCAQEAACTDETNAALETCLSQKAGLSGLGLIACNGCVNTAALSGAFLPTCAGVKSAACLAADGCAVLCGGTAACQAEIWSKISCNINQRRQNSNNNDPCPDLDDCNSDDDDDESSTTPAEDEPAPPPPPPPSPPAPPAPAPSPPLSSIAAAACSTERAALSTCLTDPAAAGMDDNSGGAATTTCINCLNTGALPASFLPVCNGVVSASCLAIQACSLACGGGGGNCREAATAFVQCQVNDGRNNKCNDNFVCNGGGSDGDDDDEEEAQPDPNANVVTDTSCTEPTTAALDACLDESMGSSGGGGGGADATTITRGLCLACLRAASVVGAFLPSCEDQVTLATCNAVVGCEELCGLGTNDNQSCRTEMANKVLCDLNGSRNADRQCATLDCTNTSSLVPPLLPDDDDDDDENGSDTAITTTVCQNEVAALDSCLDASSSSSGTATTSTISKALCDTCLGAAVVAARFLSSCETQVTPATCTALQGCEAVCGGGGGSDSAENCRTEMDNRVLCEINDSRRKRENVDQCPAPLDCSSTNASPPSLIPDGDGGAETNPTTTTCVSESTALDNCLNYDSSFSANDAVTTATKNLCDACIRASSVATGTLLPSCENQVTPAACTAIVGCEQLCGGNCRAAMTRQVLCEINAARSENSDSTEPCPTLDCSKNDDEDDADRMTQCIDSTMALDNCLENSPTGPRGNTAQNLCDACIENASQTGAYLPSCRDVVVPTTCQAIIGCEEGSCGTDCRAEMVTKILCEINTVRRSTVGTACKELDCSSAAAAPGGTDESVVSPTLSPVAAAPDSGSTAGGDDRNVDPAASVSSAKATATNATTWVILLLFFVWWPEA